jgi:tRNA A-37 threonylcarbamoyl transferase component Bud32
MTTPSADQDATLRVDAGVQHVRRSSARDGQFAPGTMVAGRYRIAGIVGSGGMGEVYRAEDVKLDQTVALKFLPAKLARDPVLLARLHDEVRLGRQISHPNVCRTYDIIEADGAHFVAMEFVEGEDLARLLRRIGRIAHDKAVDISRGIAAGLTAAHAKGILHRDLKPANVMVDSHGDARIMDFGLALAAGEDDGTISGTPAYMAPEQLQGGPATIQSDLYALGLVMYELFTGKRAHAARTMPERVRDLTSEITTPSNVIRDIDPSVERLILRCLANDPVQRPRSAREVVESLPGGDPLAAAMRAGETPSPRLVAAAGTAGSLSRAVAWSMLVAIAALFALLFYVRDARNLGRYMPPPLSPDVLHDRATAVLQTFAVPAAGNPIPAIATDFTYSAWLMKNDRWKAARPGPDVLRYRLEYGVSRRESELMPRLGSAPGRTTVEVDAQGRLALLIITPRADAGPRVLDWDALVRAAGVDVRSLRPVPPRFAPPAPFDTQRAWSGTYPGGQIPIRIEAAALRGTPTYFRITGAWDDVADPFAGVPFSGGSAFFFSVAAIVVIAGVLLAWRNLRLRRGDRQGALRMAAVIFLCELGAVWLPRFAADRLGEAAGLFAASIGEALFTAGLMCLLYMALEPFIRRRWPSLLIAWSRLVAGTPRDPMVGRDVMIGLLAGLLHCAIASSAEGFVAYVAGTDPGPKLGDAASLLGIRATLALLLNSVTAGILYSTFAIVLLVLLMMLLRRRALAAGAFFAMVLTAFIVALQGTWAGVPSVTLVALLLTVVAARYGLLALAVMHATFSLFLIAPHISTAWSMPLMLIPYVTVAMLAVWAFHTSLGGQSVVGEGVLGD